MTWTLLSDDGAIQQFLDLVTHFHDSCLREVYCVSDTFIDEHGAMRNADGRRLTAYLALQSQALRGPRAVELRFEDVVGLHLAPVPRGYDPSISSATLLRVDEVFYWAGTHSWTPALISPNTWETGAGGCIAGPITWIGGRRLFWRATDPPCREVPRYGPRALL